MKPFVPLTKPEEVDLFSIYEEDGVKYIHIHGYVWFDYPNDEEDKDGWHLQEYKWFVEELGEFIKHLKEDEDYVDHHACELQQYLDNMTVEEAVETINTYFNGECADAYLAYSDITMDTPCGNYC